MGQQESQLLSIRERLIEILEPLVSTLERKHVEYGDTYTVTTEVLCILYRHKIVDGKFVLSKGDLKHMLAITRTIDKLCRITHGNRGEENAWLDIAGYALLELQRAYNEVLSLRQAHNKENR